MATKPPSWNEIRDNAVGFVTRWVDETEENAEAQTFWNEFLAIFGIDRRRVATFEKRAQRTSTGGRGRIDLFWPSTLVAEHKSAGRDLTHAEEQALDYLESIDQDDFPGAVITSDFARLRVLDLGAEKPEAVEFPLAELPLQLDRFLFIAGYASRSHAPGHEDAANIQAAKLMARLYEQLSAAGYEGHEASVLLTRLLFLLFGDDTGMWQRGLFAEFIETRTSTDGSDLGAQLAHLFQTLNRPVQRRPPTLDELLARFPYVNGGLFGDPLEIPSFDHSMRNELMATCAFDWGTISPAIFGSLFQAVKSKEARRELGEHYTTEKNILRVIGPLFLDELRAELESSKDSERKLKGLRAKLGVLRFLDPACGCGNFLVVAYREMRSLELDILRHLQRLTGESQLSLDPTLGLAVSLDAFSGIELEEWPARIAETAMFLVDHQANMALSLDFGVMPDRLPIVVAAKIEMANALLVDWRDVVTPSDNVIILGNPPFIGSRMESPEQRADQDRVWAGNKRRGTLDYVTNWYKLAAEFIQGTRARGAFVSTNSITQGEQPAVVWDELEALGVGIDFAHRTFSWSSEAPGAAAVHVVVIGFSAQRPGGKRSLYFYPSLTGEGLEAKVPAIGPYLIEGETVVRSRQEPLVAGTPRMSFGSMPRDNGFLCKIDAETAAEIKASDPIAAKYLHRLIGAEEMLNSRERWCLWEVIDATDIRNSPVLQARLRAVKEMREASNAASTRAAASLPGRFVQRAQPTSRYLAVPRVSSEARDYVPTAYFEPEVIALDALMTVEGADAVLFGVMSSRLFSVWNRTVSGRLKSDCRISQEITYNNFPWLATRDDHNGHIATAAEDVLAVRELHAGDSLAALYSPVGMPPDLSSAHKALDRVVHAAYGIPITATDAAVASALLARHSELVAAARLL